VRACLRRWRVAPCPSHDDDRITPPLTATPPQIARARRRTTVPRQRWRRRRAATAAATAAMAEQQLLPPRTRRMRCALLLYVHRANNVPLYCHAARRATLHVPTRAVAHPDRRRRVPGAWSLVTILGGSITSPRTPAAFSAFGLSLARSPSHATLVFRAAVWCVFAPHNTRAGFSGSGDLKNTNKPPFNCPSSLAVLPECGL